MNGLPNIVVLSEPGDSKEVILSAVDLADGYINLTATKDVSIAILSSDYVSGTIYMKKGQSIILVKGE